MKIAAAYHPSELGNVSANLQGTWEILSKMKEKEVEFVLFPEMNISGYLTSEKAIKDVLEQRNEVFNRLKDFSVKLKIAFAIGFPIEVDGNYFISQILFENGEIKGIHRKTHLSPKEKEIYAESEHISMYQMGDLRMGMQLCFETHFPEISYAQAKQGANLLTMSFASPKETAEEKLERLKRYLCARAYDNACFVMVCNYSGENGNGTKFPGLAMIIDPKGNILSETIRFKSGYCLADLNEEALENIYQSKMAWFNKFKQNEILKPFYE